MGLFTPAWKSKDKRKAMQFVNKETDQRLLCRIALEADSADVCSRATRKLTDQGLLTRVAKEGIFADARDAAVTRLRDQDALKTIAAQDLSLQVRKSALQRITDESYLIAYAAQINSGGLAEYAAERIRSPQGLALLAATNGRHTIVQRSLQELGDKPPEEALVILRQSSDSKVREYLIPFGNEQERGTVARTAAEPRHRARAIRTLEDYALLYQCATEDPSALCRAAANETLRKRKKAIPADWWSAHMEEKVSDQRMALLLKRAESDSAAARELAELAVGGHVEADWLFRNITMPVIDEIEQLASAGKDKAVRLLYALYTSDKLNRVLSGQAQAQRTRFRREHRDVMVDSTVCGETFRHEDYMRNETILPL